MFKQIIAVLFLCFSFLFSSFASAAAVDLSTLTASVDFTTTTAAILLVSAALMVVYIAWKAAKMVIMAVRSN